MGNSLEGPAPDAASAAQAKAGKCSYASSAATIEQEFSSFPRAVADQLSFGRPSKGCTYLADRCEHPTKPVNLPGIERRSRSPENRPACFRLTALPEDMR